MTSFVVWIVESIPFGYIGLLLLISVSSVGIAVWIFRQSGLRNAPHPQRRLILLAAVSVFGIFLLIFFELTMTESTSVHNVFIRMVTLFSTLFLFLVAAVIIAFIGSYIGNLVLHSSTPDPASLQSHINLFAARVFDSEEFLSVLRTTLPKGNSDGEFGLDYIPFMLHGLDERRKRFHQSSSMFLRMTLLLGMFSAVIVAFFGYVLIVESSVGAPRYLRDIQSETHILGDAVTSLTPSNHTREWALRIEPLLEEARSVASRENRIILNDVLTQHGMSLTQVLPLLVKVSRDTTATNVKLYNSKIDTALARTSDLVASNQRDREIALAALDRLNGLIPRAELALNQNESRIPELIKRLAIGLIVTTFLLALLRYCAGLYSSHHREMLVTEYQDMALRRFYVAFKGSAADPEQRRTVLGSFMSGGEASVLPESSGTANSSELEASVVKELIGALSKILNR
jgi:hypothetical protein